MKTLINTYAFDKAAKQVTFSGITPALERLLLITDTTNNTIIYNFADSTKGGTMAGNVLTLTYNTNTASFNNTDKLQIYYDIELPIGTIALSQTDGVVASTKTVTKVTNGVTFTKTLSFNASGQFLSASAWT